MKSALLMPENTPRQHYVEAARGYGAEIKFAASAAEAFAKVGDFERPRVGFTFIPLTTRW